MTTLQMGSRGPEVRTLQEHLVQKGYFVGAVDGEYGPKTAAAVAYLQSTHGMHIDGIAGDQTFEALGLGLSMEVEGHWPNLEVVTPEHRQFRAEIRALGSNPVQCRVVVWFRIEQSEEHSVVDPVNVPANGSAVADVPIPDATMRVEGECFWTGLVFDTRGQELTRGTGSFRINLPNQN